LIATTPTTAVLSFIRRARDREDFLVVILNATPVVRGNYRSAFLSAASTKEILNTDSTNYGGSGVGNLGGVHSEANSCAGSSSLSSLDSSPARALIFKLQKA